MGWLCSMDPTKDRKRTVDEILADFRRNEYPYPSLVDHSLRGNTLYLVLRNPVRRPKGLAPHVETHDMRSLTFDLCGNYRFIAVYLLAGPRRGSDEGWGYKSMDESCGPNVIDCPERLLAQSQVHDRYGWRTKCREARAKANAKRRMAKETKPGEAMQLFRGYRNTETQRNVPFYETVIFDRPYSKTFFIGHFEGFAMKQYRMRWSDIRLPESEEQAA